MAAQQVKLHFEDGSEETVTITPRVIMEVESHWHPEPFPKIKGMVWGAWWRLGKPGGDFDAWSDTLTSIEQGTVDTGAASPLEQEPSPAS